MSDLAATQCGGSCGCDGGCGGVGIGANYNGGCGSNSSCIWIIILFAFCGNGCF